jgi:hypothetical protein
MTPQCFQSLNNGEQCTAPVPYSYSLFPTPYSLVPSSLPFVIHLTHSRAPWHISLLRSVRTFSRRRCLRCRIWK